MARGRRSHHSPEELRDLIIAEGSRIVTEEGIAALTAREIARRIGYSATTVLSAMGSPDAIVTAVNTRTFGLWVRELEKALERDPEDRIATLVNAYFDFAARNPKLWIAIYEHKLPVGHEVPDDQNEARGRLTAIVNAEVSHALRKSFDETKELTASLVYTVHGHCHMWITGSSDLMGIRDVRACALARVREALACAGKETQ